MRHHHIGPPDVLCPGCFVELQEDLVTAEQQKRADDKQTRRGAVVVILFLMSLAVLMCAFLSFCLRKFGTHHG